MGKILVLALLVVIAVWLVKRALRRNKAEVSQDPPVEENLVACAHCGLNLPRAEARAAGTEVFCSDEHARLGRR